MSAAGGGEATHLADELSMADIYARWREKSRVFLSSFLSFIFILYFIYFYPQLYRAAGGFKRIFFADGILVLLS